MSNEQEHCKYGLAYSVQFSYLRGDLDELKERVSRLETMLGRGMLLLVANLVGVVMTLLRQLAT